MKPIAAAYIANAKKGEDEARSIDIDEAGPFEMAVSGSLLNMPMDAIS